MGEHHHNAGLVRTRVDLHLFTDADKTGAIVAFVLNGGGQGGKTVNLCAAYEALKLVGLEDDYFYQSPFELSGGQKRRVAIAGVLAMKPDVLILDEPTAGLDPKGRDEILDQIAKLKKETGITVILVSHSMDDVAKYVDRIIVMNKGRVKFDDAPKEVFKHYDELEEIGLAAPQVTYIMKKLRASGYDVSDEPTTIEEAKTEIIKYFNKNNYFRKDRV